MPTESIQVSDVIPGTPQRIYEAWMDAGKHAAMTAKVLPASSRAEARRLDGSGRCTGCAR